MSHPSASRNLNDRLRDGESSARLQQHAGADSIYVQHIRGYVADCPNSGSQQHRLRYGDENWLISQYRWLVEQRAHGADWSRLRRVLQATVDELDVMAELEAADIAINTDTLIDAAKEETAAGFYEDTATLDAVQHKTPGTLRQLADRCYTQATALKQKGRIALTLAAKLTTQRSA